MSSRSPFNAQRDGQPGGYAFGDPTPGDLVSGHESQAMEGFSDGTVPPPRPRDTGGSSDSGPDGSRFAYPWLRGEAGRLADG